MNIDEIHREGPMLCTLPRAFIISASLVQCSACSQLQCMQSIAHDASSRMRSTTAFAQDVGKKTTDHMRSVLGSMRKIPLA